MSREKMLRLAHRYLVRQTMPGWAAAYYDRLIGNVAEIYLCPFVDEILREFSGPLKILDAGTGAGHLPALLAKRRTDFAITGVDLSSACLELAKEKVRAGKLDGVQFVRGDLEKMRFPDASFDLVVSTCSLHHWRRPAAVLRELVRVLKLGGELWLLDDAGEASPAARKEWVAEVERRARSGWLFRSVFWFESRFLAYSQREVRELTGRAGLSSSSFDLCGVFFLARFKRQTHSGA